MWTERELLFQWSVIVTTGQGPQNCVGGVTGVVDRSTLNLLRFPAAFQHLVYPDLIPSSKCRLRRWVMAELPTSYLPPQLTMTALESILPARYP